MSLGDFEWAWRVSDRVLAERNHTTRDDTRLPYHLRWVWDGRPFNDKRVLVRCYHGLGDTVQFCRFLNPLRGRALHVTVELQPALITLLKSFQPSFELIPFDPAHPTASSECDIEIMELPHALRIAPDPKPYLRAPDRPKPHRFRVGLCWQASRTWLPERSLPSHLLTTILSCPNVEFVSLQQGGGVAPGLAADCPTSILETANRIAGLDLVLSVDTMVAHLAGALGVPLWLLLKSEPDWRWIAGGTDSVWYARVRKYFQPRPGDWETLIQAIAVDLKELADRELCKTTEVFSSHDNPSAANRNPRSDDHFIVGERACDDLSQSDPRSDSPRSQRFIP